MIFDVFLTSIKRESMLPVLVLQITNALAHEPKLIASSSRKVIIVGPEHNEMSFPFIQGQIVSPDHLIIICKS